MTPQPDGSALIPTASSRELVLALQDPDVRKIGVIGPHGVGKSALLEAYGWLRFSDGATPEVLAVRAPVQYVKDDFLGELMKSMERAVASGRPVRVVIGSLHHIAPAEHAERFLSDVMGVVGERARQIVIVARKENLVGDVDHTVRVKPLRLNESIALLENEVIGFPAPLALLVHCVAGGVPTNLVRLAALVHNPVRPQREFDSILDEVLEQELPGPAGGPAFAVRQTILEVFSDPRHSGTLDRAAGEQDWVGSLDVLAHARRLVGTDPREAEEIIARFREVWSLDPVEAEENPVEAQPDSPIGTPRNERHPVVEQLEDVRLEQLIGVELDMSDTRRVMRRAGLDRAALTDEVLNARRVRDVVRTSSEALVAELPSSAGAGRLRLQPRVAWSAERVLMLLSGLVAVLSVTVNVSVVAGALTMLLGIVVVFAEWRLARRSSVAPATRIEELKTFWEQNVLEHGVRPALQSRLTDALKSLQWISLVTANKAMMYHAQDDQFTVDTEPVRLFDKATTRSGGAIGLAGPRGSGKTSLIRRRVLRGKDSRDPITVRVSAPVRYEPRDFVLHLHSKLCREVIRMLGAEKGRSSGHPDWARLADRARESRRTRQAAQRMFWSVLVLVGAAAWALVAGTVPSAMVGRLAELAEKGSSPAAISLAAIVLAAFYFAWAVLTFSWLPAHRRGWSPREAARALVFPKPPLTNDEVMVRLAEQDLRQIRFLQTHTTGWSGRLTIPVKLAVTRTSTTQLAQRPLTHPELVEQLRQFLKQLVQVRSPTGTEPSVLISIDELDKIEPPEDAYRFINEIKGVFGVRGCQFVISVSEEALTAFERRGTAPRDAFDSAFDEIVRVGYLTLRDTDLLLSKRAGDIAEPFRYLCHCLSGGLPREVIRVAQSMVAMAGPDDMPSLAEVAQQLVIDELGRKADSVQEAAARIGAGADVADFVRAIHACIANPSPLMLLRNAPAAGSGDNSPLDRLRFEARTYLRFAATILQVFDDDLDPDKVHGARVIADDPGSFDSLAAVLKRLAGHPMVAALTLDRFRRAWQLDPGVPPAARGLTASRQLLRDRSLELPDRLDLLCHCVSGGAPWHLRQLAGKARVLRSHESQPTPATVAGRLVLDDLRDRLQHVRAEVRKQGLGRQVDAVAEMVAWHSDATAAQRLLDRAGPPAQVNGYLGALWLEGRTCLRFAATLLQVFAVEGDLLAERCADLARVSQLVATDTASASTVLDEVRAACGLAA